MITVGMPRALLYYDCIPTWAEFYHLLGANVVVSPDTTKSIIDAGVSLSADDACLPVKIYFGHAAAMAPECDFLFVPRLVSIERGRYMCPKFLGLPDMVRAILGEHVRLIDPTIDLSRSARAMPRVVVNAASPITKNPARALSAWRACKRYRLDSIAYSQTPEPQTTVRIGVLAHPYIINDAALSFGILDKLHRMGIEPVLDDDIRVNAALPDAPQPRRRIFWTHENRIYAAGMTMASQAAVDGIIIVQAFGCGPGSMIFDLFVRRCRREYALPTLTLSVDEHTGEAGIVTRLEAFADMLLRTARGCG